MRVTRIVDPHAAAGDSWSQASVQLDNGQIVRIFNPINVGDEVESYQNGRYTNWRIMKPKAGAGAGIPSDTEKTINQMAGDIKTLSERVEQLERAMRNIELESMKNASQMLPDTPMPDDFLKI